MRSSIISSTTIATVLSLSNIALADDLPVAAVVYNNPQGVKYQAEFTKESTVTGSVSFEATNNGTGITVTVDLANFPTAGGPFLYHVHDFPVAADGNCSSTGAHLDPTKRGETPPCDPTNPATCQVGDLSGKHGKIPEGGKFQTSYTDLFADTVSGSAASVEGHSVTIHLANKTRIACANITLVPSTYTPPSQTNSTSPTTGSNATTSSVPTPYSPPASTNAAVGTTFAGLTMAACAGLAALYMI